MYDKIMYVAKCKLDALTKQIKTKKADEITPEDVAELTFPEDLDDAALLIPVDISGAGKDFPVMHEEMLEKLGPKKAVQAIIDAAALFSKNSATAFSKEDLPIPMTAGQWREEAGLNGDDEGSEEDEDDGDDAEGEEEEEEDGEEDENIDKSNISEPPAKKKKSA